METVTVLMWAGHSCLPMPVCDLLSLTYAVTFFVAFSPTSLDSSFSSLKYASVITPQSTYHTLKFFFFYQSIAIL